MEILIIGYKEISAQNKILVSKRDHIQKLYNQLSDEWEFIKQSKTD